MSNLSKWIKSRTINWAGVVAALGALQLALPSVRESIPADVYGYVLLAISVLMAYLRVTHRPVAGESKAPSGPASQPEGAPRAYSDE